MEKNKLHILVVDDDNRIRELIKEYLSENNYIVSTAENALEANEKLSHFQFDLLVLDVMMPGKTGFDLTKEIKKYSDLPIILLTAKGEVENRIKGLEIGADDYLPKPFELQELLARVRSQLRRQDWSNRTQERTNPALTFGDAEVNFETHEATFDGHPVSLTRLEIDLLRYFADHPGRVLSREELLREVWGLSGEVRSRTVDNFVLRLRKLFEHDPANPRHILSVRGAGYVFQAD